jgi:hypothetical protein
MAYAGLPPALFTNNLTNVQLIDDISGSFNGSTQTFALTSNSAPFHAVSARSLIVVLGGIVQKPQVDYTVDGANITFTVAPVSGLTFGARNIYGLNYLDNVNDGVITPAKLSTGGPSWNTSGTVTVSGDLNVVGSFNSGTQGLFWGDNEPANFGNSNDLQIYHDGSHSYISESSGTGDLRLVSTRTLIRDENDTNHCIIANSGGSVDLYHNGTKKFETTSGGIFVSGTARVPNATAFTSSDSGGTERWLMYMSGGVSPSSGNKLIIGNPLNDDVILFTNNTERLRITSGGNVGIGTNNPTQKLHVIGNGLFNDGVNGGILLGNSSARKIFGGTSYSGIRLYVATGESFVFHTNENVERLTLSNTGNLLPGADATQDLGSPTKRWANIYSADLQLSNEGSSNDVDGTWGQYTIQEGENDLFLLNRRNGKKYKFVLQEVN